jgi:hypothetical protein
MFPSMRITWRRSWSAEPERNDVSWDQLVNVLQANSRVQYTPNPDPKYKPLDLPLISFGHFYVLDGVVDRQGRLTRWDHRNLDPAGLSGLALDYDDAPADEFARALELAKARSAHGIAHTTWLHGTPKNKAGVRARMLLPFPEGELVPSGVWSSVWEHAARQYYATGLDTSCSNPERCFFVPATNPQATWPCWFEAW